MFSTIQNNDMNANLPTGKVVPVLYVGGPPGKTWRNIQQRLNMLGYVVVDHWNPGQAKRKECLPKCIELVLLNLDIDSHTATARIKQMAAKQGLRCVRVHNNMSSTLQNLQADRSLGNKYSVDQLMRLSEQQLEQPMNELEQTELPIEQPPVEENTMASFAKNLDAILNSLFKDEESLIANVKRFLAHEIDVKADRIINVLDRVPQSINAKYDETLLADLQEQQNLSTWARENDISYAEGLRKVLQFASHDLVVRIPPYTGSRIIQGVPTISFHFSLSKKGTAVQRGISESLGQSKNTDTEDGMNNSKLQSNPHQESISKPLSLFAQPTVEPALPSEKSNFNESLKMLLEVMRSEHSDITGLFINAETGEITMERKINQKFRL